ncbi:MAG: hypothetical protein R2830_27365 [Saprospiraceae bacterium]|nr:hypothetical protein [Saprospiraceae bacterium]
MKAFATFCWRITSSHVITYFLMGLVASQVLNYEELFETEPFSHFMKPLNSAAIGVGPALQVIRGLIFSIALWAFRDVFLKTINGWLKLWGLLVGLSVLSTTAAGPGSVEGFIYTTIPVWKQVCGYLEVLPQTLLFSLLLYYWYQKPGKAWNIVSIVLVAIILLMSGMAVAMAGT